MKKIFIEIIKPLLEGLALTLKHFFKKPITLQYPLEKWNPYPRFRGLHFHLKDKEGREKCVACGLCAAVCPANVISMVAGELSDGTRYAEEYVMDITKCAFCGFCEEACPTGAIFMGRNYEYTCYSRDCLIMQKFNLLEEAEKNGKKIEDVFREGRGGRR